MSNINPQYTFDNTGNPVGVFLPIEDWNAISKELHLDLPQWQKDLIDTRLAQYRSNPADTTDWNSISDHIELTPAQKTALDKELQAIKENPDYLLKWGDIKHRYKKP